jgi:hypothetical protein
MTKSNEESKKIWEQFLAEENIKHFGYTPLIEKETDHYAVIIEPRVHSDLLTVIKSTMFHLNETNSPIKWGLQIFHGNQNKEFVENIQLSLTNVVLTNIGIDNFTHQEHSRYMESVEFWKQVKGTKALIFQTDSLLLRSGIDDFLGYDYVGAPWRKPKENQWVGNGGLSLRTVSKMIEICKNNPVDEEILEDIYFMKYMKGVGVADIEMAMKFSMEDVFSPNPLGVHNPIRHITPEQLKKVLYKNIIN